MTNTTIIYLVIAIVLLLIVLAVKVFIDVRLWMNERKIDHKKERWRWWVLALSCSPSIALFTLASNFLWYIAAPLSAVMCALFIWLMFDGIYNIARRENWWFTGTNDKEDAIPDNFLQAVPLWMQILLKTVPLATLIYLYIKGL